MKTITILIVCFLIQMSGSSQTNEQKLNSFGVSLPFIWNKSAGVYYPLGNRKEPTGNSMSYGINLNYTRAVYKNISAVVGLGYYKQSFDIIRPFNYDSPIEVLWHTESYYYDNVHILVGINYKRKLSEKYLIGTGISINHFYSFHQKYIVNSEYKTWQDNKNTFSIGETVNTELSIERKLSNKFSVDAAIVLPVYCNWKTDEIFIKNEYYDGAQRIALNKFSIGTTISIKYQF